MAIRHRRQSVPRGRHGLCADGFYRALQPLIEKTGGALPKCEAAHQRLRGGQNKDVVEECFWEALLTIRSALEDNRGVVIPGQRIQKAKDRLEARRAGPRERPERAGDLRSGGENRRIDSRGLALSPGKTTTLRGELGRVLQHYNKVSKGAVLAAAADLLGSTSVNTAPRAFRKGFTTPPPIRGRGFFPSAGSARMHGRDSFRAGDVWAPSRRGFFLWRLPCAFRPHCRRLHAIGSQARRAIAPNRSAPSFWYVPRRGQNRRRRPDPCRPQPLQLLQEIFLWER